MGFTTFLQRFVPNKWFMAALAIIVIGITLIILFTADVGGVSWVLSLIIGSILLIGSIVGFFGLRSWENNPMNPKHKDYKQYQPILPIRPSAPPQYQYQQPSAPIRPSAPPQYQYQQPSAPIRPSAPPQYQYQQPSAPPQYQPILPIRPSAPPQYQQPSAPIRQESVYAEDFIRGVANRNNNERYQLL